MTDKDAFNALVAQNQGLRQLVVDALSTWFWGLNFSNPYQVTAAIEDFLPQLITQYGDVAATIASDYFDLVRANAGIEPNYRSTLTPADVEDLGPSIGWAAQGLYQDDLNPADVLNRLVETVDVRVKEAGTNTLVNNADRDPYKPKYARVPVGDTCEFCRLLGSQGFAYHSEHSAKFGSDGDKYHNDCDCQIVVDYDVTNPSLAGYEPDKLFKEYEEATKNADGSSLKDVLQGYRKVQAEKDGREFISTEDRIANAGLDSNKRSSTSSTSSSSTGKKTKPTYNAWDDPEWINHQLSVTEDLPETDWRSGYLDKLNARKLELTS